MALFLHPELGLETLCFVIIVTGSEISMTVITNKMTSGRTNAVLQSVKPTNPSQEVCLNYIMRPEGDRKCMMGQSCIFGRCEIVEGRKKCICDKGAHGQFCKERCCLDCGQFGTCMIAPWDNSEFCFCDHGYTGPRCSDHTRPDDQTQETTSESHNDIGSITDNETLNVSHACSDEYTLRPLADRKCLFAECIYGFCDRMECQCDAGSWGRLCEKQCCLDCGRFGNCWITPPNDTEICNCIDNHTGPTCSQLIEFNEPISEPQTDSQWYLWVVGTCSGMLFVLLVLVVIVPYVMWKHRVILVMRIVHYFQGYEDDDEREWDAFISYKSAPADEAFVTKVLYRKLEEEYGFKLNVHFRDFIPGNTIANNIINAVKGSRRTILVITAQYIKSEYTRLEYQVAQQQMLEHKHRIIPILLEDISDCEQFMDPNLKFILKSVTYLEWPRDNSPKHQNKFWKRLQLSMPKKRNQNVRNIIPQRPDVVENNIPNQRNGQREIVIPRIHIENEEDHYHTIDDVMRL